MKRLLLLGLLFSQFSFAQTRPWADLKIYNSANTVVLNPGDLRVVEAMVQTENGEIVQEQQSSFSPKIFIHCFSPLFNQIQQCQQGSCVNLYAELRTGERASLFNTLYECK